MDKSLNTLRQQLIELLPEGEPSIEVSRLKQWGFPEIIADRMLLELSDQIYSSISKSLTPWMQSVQEEFESITESYVERILAITKLPMDVFINYLEGVISEVIDQCLQPRIKIPQQVFGDDKLLNYKEIQYRSRYVLQHKTLVTAILRYMERKGLTELTFEQANDLITKIDERLVATYSPEDWAHSLEMPFSMMEGRMETGLITRYFEQRGVPRYADKFRGKTGSLQSQEFLELLFEEPEPEKAPDEALKPLHHPHNAATSSPSSTLSTQQQSKDTPVEHTNLLGSFSSEHTLPLWQRFLEYIPEEAAPEISASQGTPSAKMSLREWLITDQTSFVRHLFKGNHQQFDQLTETLGVMNDWQQAQEWLQTHWLPTLVVDIEDDIFIMFIDQLQAYFNYKKN